MNLPPMDTKDFERRLLAIDWEKIGDPIFEPISVPTLGLLRSAPAEREVWAARLEYSLLPQSTLGDGVALALPFLRELLADLGLAPHVYELLVYVALCTDAPHSAGYVGECRSKLRAGLDLYLHHLTSQTVPVTVRSAALGLVVQLHEDRATWGPALKALCAVEADATLRDELADSLRWVEAGDR